MIGSISAVGATKTGRTISGRTAPSGGSVCIATRRGIGLIIVVILTLYIAQRPNVRWDQIISTMGEAVPNMPKRWFPYLEPIGKRILLPR
jgi:hypothetical protein